MSDGFLFTVDIEVYDTGENKWAQARYLVHGVDDVLWTDDIDQAVRYLRAEIEKEQA